MTESPRFGSPTMRRILRSYGLVIVIAIAFLLLAMFMREKPTVVPVQGIGVHAVSTGEVGAWL